MFESIIKKLERTVKFDGSVGEYKGSDIIGYILQPTEKEAKSFIMNELDEKRKYHNVDKFTKEHIKNIFKQQNMYINKDIIKWLDDEGYVV
jgi:hypothetical protein